MTDFSRRGVLVGAGAALALAAGCGNGIESQGGAVIDSRVDATRRYLYDRYPGAKELAEKASGILYMPLITKAGFGIGGSYGRGALRIDNATVDYYSATQATFGVQVGAQQYAHVLFFMNDRALSNFRRSEGYSLGGDIEYAVRDEGGNLSAQTLTEIDPVVAVVFGQTGLIVGATLQGTKYTRIIP